MRSSRADAPSSITRANMCGSHLKRFVGSNATRNLFAHKSPVGATRGAIAVFCVQRARNKLFLSLQSQMDLSIPATPSLNLCRFLFENGTSMLFAPSKWSGRRQFLKSESGAISIDFVLWMPFLMALLLIATDATVGFMRQAHMWQTSREAARIVSRYGMDEATAEAYVQAETRIGETIPEVDVSFGAGEVNVETSIPIQAMTPFNLFAFALDDTFKTNVTFAMEPF